MSNQERTVDSTQQTTLLYRAENAMLSKDDARLIAAAPDLLEACETMVNWFESYYTELMTIDSHFQKNKMINKAKQAIAQSEGKEI